MSAKKIAQSFPNPVLDPCEGLPTYATISAWHVQLNGNAALVQSDLSDSQYGLILITVSETVYNTLSTTGFVVPTNPGATVTLPLNPTGPQISQLNRAHSENIRVWHEWNTANKALKQLLIKVVPEKCIRALHNKMFGYAKVLTRDMLVHLSKSMEK